MTTAQFEARFPVGDEEACYRYLIARRWPQGVHCPRCGNTELYDASSYKPFHWQCLECSKAGPYRFSALVGTIFENTKKPLRDWYRVAHLMLSSKKGMSALQIQRMMGFGSYETAHSMCHKIRAGLIAPEQKLGGIVEVDETWVGGKDKNRHWGKRSGKSGLGSRKIPIIGAVERQGNVVARVLSRVTSQAMLDFVNETVSNKVSLLATDSWPGYSDYLRHYPHATVDHHAKQYVVGAVHTQTIEGFWSVMKGGLNGVYRGAVSKENLQSYVDEYAFHWNHRTGLRGPDPFRVLLNRATEG